LGETAGLVPFTVMGTGFALGDVLMTAVTLGGGLATGGDSFGCFLAFLPQGLRLEHLGSFWAGGGEGLAGF
jgi:hypothetical protein